MRAASALLPLLLALSAHAPAQVGGRVTEREAAALAIDAPAFEGRGAYISQIGSDNRAGVRQSAARARAEVRQTGDANTATIDQRGSGTAYASVAQLGDGNRAGVEQGGVGSNTLLLSQTGAGNAATVGQNSSASAYNGATLAQTGSDNRLSLAQNGSDNRAVLAQTGDGNAMSAVQNGAGNRLAWMQEGSGLSDLQIVQNGGQALYITQTGGR